MEAVVHQGTRDGSSKLLNPFELPFSQLNADELRKEIWSTQMLKRRPGPKKRGNFVRNHVLSRLRIEAKVTRLRGACNLEVLWDFLPSEVISLIFGFLHPIDLYHATRATKDLRRFLLNKSSSIIWRESFLNHADSIPFYPDDVSAPQWTAWVFDPALCDICGEDDSLFDYTYRYRRCSNCMDYHSIYGDDMAKRLDTILGEFPEERDDIWRVAFCTGRYLSYRYPSEDDDFDDTLFSLEDCTRNAQEMRHYLLDVQNCVPSAKEKYEAFVSIKEAASKQRYHEARQYNDWAHNIYESCDMNPKYPHVSFSISSRDSKRPFQTTPMIK